MKKRKGKIQHWQVIAVLLAIFDFFAIIVSYFTALMLRFDMIWSHIPTAYLQYSQRFTLPYAFLCIAIFAGARLYKSMWRYASYTELLRCLTANAAAFVPFVIITVMIRRMPISWYAIGFILQVMLTTGIRMSYRFLNLLRSRQ